MCVCGKSITVTNRRKQKDCRAAQSSITQVLSSSWSAVNTYIVLQEALDGPVHLCWDVGSSDLTGKKPEAQTDCCPHCGSHPVSVCITPECSWVFGLIPNPGRVFSIWERILAVSSLTEWLMIWLTVSLLPWSWCELFDLSWKLLFITLRERERQSGRVT